MRRQAVEYLCVATVKVLEVRPRAVKLWVRFGGKERAIWAPGSAVRPIDRKKITEAGIDIHGLWLARWKLEEEEFVAPRPPIPKEELARRRMLYDLVASVRRIASPGSERMTSPETMRRRAEETYRKTFDKVAAWFAEREAQVRASERQRCTQAVVARWPDAAAAINALPPLDDGAAPA